MQQDFKFLREETGELETVQREKWRWVAIYNDGSEVRQFDEATGRFHQFKEIDQSKLKTFRMISDKNPIGFYLLFQPEHMKLIHFYRNVVFNYESKDRTKIKLYVFGYEENINGRTHKRLTCIMPDDGVVLTDDPSRIDLAPKLN